MDANLNIAFEIPSTVYLSEGKINGILYIDADAPCIIEEASVSLYEVIEIEGKDQEVEEKENILGAVNVIDYLEVSEEKNERLDFSLYFHRKTQRHRVMFPSWSKFGQRLRRMYKSVDLMNSHFYIESYFKIAGNTEPFIYREPVNMDVR